MMKTNDWLPSSPNQIGGVRTRLITPLHVAKNVSLKVLIDSNYSLIYDLSSSAGAFFLPFQPLGGANQQSNIIKDNETKKLEELVPSEEEKIVNKHKGSLRQKLGQTLYDPFLS